MRTIAAQVVGSTTYFTTRKLRLGPPSLLSTQPHSHARLGTCLFLQARAFQIARTPGQRRSVFALSLWTLSVSLPQRRATLFSLRIDCHRIDGEKELHGDGLGRRRQRRQKNHCKYARIFTPAGIFERQQ